MARSIQPNRSLSLVLALVAVATPAFISDGQAQQRIVQRFPGSTVSYTLDPLSSQPAKITVTINSPNGKTTRTLSTMPGLSTMSITYTTDYRAMFEPPKHNWQVRWVPPQSNQFTIPFDPVPISKFLSVTSPSTLRTDRLAGNGTPAETQVSISSLPNNSWQRLNPDSSTAVPPALRSRV